MNARVEVRILIVSGGGVCYRRELCRTEIERLHQSEELKRQEYDTKSSEFEKGRMMLRAMLSPHMFQAADEFIDMSVSIITLSFHISNYI